MPTPDVLIVEDEPDIGDLIRFHVEREGFRTEVIASGRVAFDVIRKHKPGVVILDLMLPDLDGLEICKRLKWDAETRQIPILIVSAKGEESDIVTGLELGADDYVTKPFSPKVLMARLKNIVKRRQAPPEPGERRRITLADGAVVVDLDRHALSVSGEVVDMTRTEFGILAFLAQKPGFVRTRDQVIASIHGNDAVLTPRTIDVHMTAIRRKLGLYGSMIRTVRGVGYRLEDTTIEAGV